jgi:hypothetical protein
MKSFVRTTLGTVTIALCSLLSLYGCEQESSQNSGEVIIVDGAGGTGAAGGSMGNGAGGVAGAGGAAGMENTGGSGGGGGAGAQGGMNAGGAGGAGGQMGMAGAGGVGGSGTPNPEACDANQFNMARDSFEEDDEGVLRYVGYSTIPSQQDPVTDLLLIEIHPERGFPMESGTYDLAEIGSDLNTCQICVLSFQGIDVTSGMRRMNMMATSGQIEITNFPAVTEQFQATLRDVNLREVSVTRNQLDRLVTEYPEGGETLCVDGYSMDVLRSPRPARIGEPVLDFMLQNCLTEEWVSVGEIAATTQAVWFLGTAGWCPACRNLMLNGDAGGRQVDPPFQMATEMGPERLRLMIVLGENANHAQADLRYCQQYAASYADDAADFYLDHDGTRAFAQLFGYLHTYASDDGMFGLPWNAVLSGGDGPIYRYADRSGQPERLGQIISTLTEE